MALDPIEALVASQQIAAVKARYFRHIDTRNWDQLGSVFADHVSYSFDGSPITEATAAELVAYVRSRLTTARTVHHGHMPELTIHTPDSASGIWAMNDLFDDATQHIAFRGTGHYHDRYVRDDNGDWRISYTQLVRLRIDPFDPSPPQP